MRSSLQTLRSYAEKMLQALKSPALKIIWRSSASQRKRLALLSLLFVVGALLSLGFTLVMKELVDAAVSGNRQDVIGYALLLCGFICATLASGYARRILDLKIRTNLLKSMRVEAMHRLLHKKYGAMQVYHSGELVNHVFSDISVVAGGVINIVPPLLYLLIQLFGAMIILLRLNIGFMLILLVTGALGAVVSFAFRHKMKAFHKDTQQAEDKFHARIQETLSNLRIIKASGTEERMEEEIGMAQQRFSAAQMRRGRFSALMGTGLGLVFRGSWFYALLWGCAGIYRGTFSYGTLTAILQLVGQIQSPFEELISTMSTAYGAVSSAERLMELYELPDEMPMAEVSDAQLKAFEEIRLENVEFAYEKRKKVLCDVDLTIRAGDTLAIMGPSGCGKSTLFSVMLGIYAPEAGSYRVKLAGEETDGPVCGLFAYVPQGNALFSGTLRDNIALFCKTPVSDAEIWKAAELSCIDEFIRAQAAGLDTLIGEHGIGLSEGQAQRVAIARALLTDCPVLLLDEATSALDEQTEARLLEMISGLKD